MADILQQTLPGQPAPGQWINPVGDAAAQAQAMANAPAQPMFSPEEIQQRQASNRHAYLLGVLGQLSGDDDFSNVGGSLLKQALGDRQERVTEKGTFDPITGQMRANPMYTQEQAKSRAEHLGDLAIQAQAGHQNTQETQAFQTSQAATRFAQEKELERLRQSNTNANQPPEMIIDPVTGQSKYVSRADAIGKQPFIPSLGLSGTGAKMPAEIGRMQIAFKALDSTLDEYDKLLNTFDPRSPKDFLDPSKRALLQNMQSRIDIASKEAASLGALSGADLELIHNMNTAPASMQGAAYGRDALRTQVNQTRQWIKTQNDAVMKVYGGGAQAPKLPTAPGAASAPGAGAGAPGGWSAQVEEAPRAPPAPAPGGFGWSVS